MDDLVARDARVLWHPATHFEDLARLPVTPIVAARGAWLEAEGGRRILDGIGSWWTSIHGHGHPHIVAAIREQVGRLDHVMFAGFTHAPAVELAEALLEAAPRPRADQGPDYGRVFFADCGSAAIDVCLVADGTYDAFWERRLSTWDLAAGVAIALSAGGTLSHLDGGPAVLDGGHVLLDNGFVHDDMLRLLRESVAIWPAAET